jgi:hypothetical protein
VIEWIRVLCWPVAAVLIAGNLRRAIACVALAIFKDGAA